MSVKKHLWFLIHLALPGAGFALTCIGVYLVSLQVEHKFTWRVIPAYIIMAIGLLAMLSGVFWTIFQSMKTKIYQRGCNREDNIQIYTVERRTSFPPSYEESQQSRICADAAAEFVVVVNGVDMMMSLAPPLYSQDSSEAPDCTWSWEQPPQYSQVEGIQQGQADAEERSEARSGH